MWFKFPDATLAVEPKVTLREQLLVINALKYLYLETDEHPAWLTVNVALYLPPIMRVPSSFLPSQFIFTSSPLPEMVFMVSPTLHSKPLQKSRTYLIFSILMVQLRGELDELDIVPLNGIVPPEDVLIMLLVPVKLLILKPHESTVTYISREPVHWPLSVLAVSFAVYTPPVTILPLLSFPSQEAPTYEEPPPNCFTIFPVPSFISIVQVTELFESMTPFKQTVSPELGLIVLEELLKSVMPREQVVVQLWEEVGHFHSRLSYLVIAAHFCAPYRKQFGLLAEPAQFVA